tara:strand:+ start:797 stop:955 length:159 start_codon:yes stop_codon:yes gene_type:complete
MIEMIEQIRQILIKKDQRIHDLVGRVDELERALEYYEKEERIYNGDPNWNYF